MRAAIYARVSTLDQNCEMQLREIREYITRRGWTINDEYVDRAWSGAKASRPELDRCMRDAALHKFDAVLVWKLDRFGRSVLNLSEQLQSLTSHGIRFLATSQGIDTDQSNPTSRLLLHILAAVAEFERELIKERVLAGVRTYSKAYEAGKVGAERHSRSGKNLPQGRPRCVFDRRRAIEMRDKGMSVRAISAKLRVGVGTIHRAISESNPKPAKKAPKKAFQKPVSRRGGRR
jgi:DNA invertase Pin-like site-specific DNA recombinase